jgi:CrcB protein
MQKLLFVGIGSFFGGCLRYLVSLYSPRFFGTQLPYGTLIVNVVGGLLIGFIMELGLTSNQFSPELKLFLTTGILGGLTTFSTFSYETVNFLSEGKYMSGLANTCLNLFLSFGAVAAGKFLARLL